tara:strand:+ start:13217 stop:13456 length:240 start_codon:yes stop_codon:yes gene_type:complete
MKMFVDREAIEHPCIVKKIDLPPNDFTFRTDVLLGTYYLIIPKTAKEIFYIQLLTKNIDVFIPAEGEGLLLSKKALRDL